MDWKKAAAALAAVADNIDSVADSSRHRLLSQWPCSPPRRCSYPVSSDSVIRRAAFGQSTFGLVVSVYQQRDTRMLHRAVISFNVWLTSCKLRPGLKQRLLPMRSR